MGRESKITYEQVAAIAEQLKATGGKPTTRAVRETLGVGSFGTVNRLLSDWKASQAHPGADVLTLPPALQQAFLQYVDEAVAAVKATLTAELVDQQQETAELAADNERQASLLEEIGNQLSDQNAEISNLAHEISSLEFQLATANDCTRREREAAELLRMEHAKALLQVGALPRLETDLGDVRARLEQETHSRMLAEQQSAVLAAKLEAATAKADKMEADAAEGRELVRSFTAATGTATAEQAQLKIAGLIRQIDEQRIQLDNEVQNRAQVLQRAEVLAARLEAAQARAGKAEAEIGEAREHMRRLGAAVENVQIEQIHVLKRLAGQVDLSPPTPVLVKDKTEPTADN